MAQRAPSLRYIKSEELLDYVRRYPGLSARELTCRLGSDVSRSLRQLLKAGKVTRIKEGVWRWYIERR